MISTLTAPTRPHHQLIAAWLRLWNGEPDLAETIISPQFRLHAALLGGADEDSIDDAGALTGWITSTRAAVKDLTFTLEVGPLTDTDHVALRWRATGHYSGGFPGATAAPGTPVDFTGTDMLRIEDGRIAEYWVNSDMHVLLGQLGVRS
ncbi:ester cyclase [Amycolatopsis sp. PS_44_ISF1]|uniref:ester cyclase n=1 Tax=Amycolatopsis sp. PS_44_ISF1 TaxID=2974917 RepID=UPI0028E0769B|nr:ester cyclase [Amycolatopsis sp. PS_44_ISF1]MDT8913483.1 ester cyclase [Amycolatopsis sp. PS_44_ISF1]